MKLAVSNLAWPSGSDAAAAELFASAGLRGIELAPMKVWPEAPDVDVGAARDYAAWWRGHGCDVVAFQALFFGHSELSIFSTRDRLRATQEHLEGMGRLAEACGARVLVLGSPANRRREDRPMGVALADAAAALRPVAEALASTGVSLCIEPNPARYGCDFVQTAKEAVDLAASVAHPNFGVHLDAASLFLSGELSEAALARTVPYLRHFHVSELDLAAVGSESGVPHREIGRTLRKIGYDRWISIEMLTEKHDDWRGALRQAADVARRSYLE